MTYPLLSILPKGNSVIHLGAHHGQEAHKYNAHESAVMWVEACPLFMPQLQRNIQCYPQQTCRQAVISDRGGQRRLFHISNNFEGVSSSLHDFGPGAQELWPELDLQHIQSLPVLTTTLDTLLEQEIIWLRQYQPAALVIDVQGAELEALKGGVGSLWRFNYIQVETSSASVYSSGSTRESVHALLVSAGFELLAELEQRPGHGDRLYARVVELSQSDTCFATSAYQRINHARLSHLSSLQLPLNGRSVLELGSGPGDITPFFLKQGCSVTSVDGRAENIYAAAKLHEHTGCWSGYCYDLRHQLAPSCVQYDVIASYGILYHLDDPLGFIRAMAALQPSLLLLETCVTPEYSFLSPLGHSVDPVHPCKEKVTDGSQSIIGQGSRPNRRWLWRSMQAHFSYVYSLTTQPDHPEFPSDWTTEDLLDSVGLTRMIFLASAEPLPPSSLWLEGLPLIQHR